MHFLRRLFSKKTKPKIDLHKKMDVIEINSFQFFNLIKNPVRFAFFDLREGNIKNRFPKSLAIAKNELIEHIQIEIPQLDFPVLIICETGNVSKKVAEQLVTLGYKNITILIGGTSSLSEQHP